MAERRHKVTHITCHVATSMFDKCMRKCAHEND